MARKRKGKKKPKNKTVQLCPSRIGTISKALESSSDPAAKELLSFIQRKAAGGMHVVLTWTRRTAAAGSRPAKKPRLPEEMWAYGARNHILRELGFENYEQYLASELWTSIRTKALDKDRRICVRCRAYACQVHHAKYTRENLSGASLDGLHAVCKACHKQAEVRADGTKGSLDEANAFLFRQPIDKNKPKGFKPKPAIKPTAPPRMFRQCAACGERPPVDGGLCGWCIKTGATASAA